MPQDSNSPAAPPAKNRLEQLEQEKRQPSSLKSALLQLAFTPPEDRLGKLQEWGVDFPEMRKLAAVPGEPSPPAAPENANAESSISLPKRQTP